MFLLWSKSGDGPCNDFIENRCDTKGNTNQDNSRERDPGSSAAFVFLSNKKPEEEFNRFSCINVCIWSSVISSAVIYPLLWWTFEHEIGLKSPEVDSNQPISTQHWCAVWSLQDRKGKKLADYLTCKSQIILRARNNTFIQLHHVFC